ncbi:progranulin [Folsomia candida]|nr:progranulin [Folsomia candida]
MIAKFLVIVALAVILAVVEGAENLGHKSIFSEIYQNSSNIAPLLTTCAECDRTETCCTFPGALIGCCEYSSAVCCPDLFGCCPSGYRCPSRLGDECAAGSGRPIIGTVFMMGVAIILLGKMMG